MPEPASSSAVEPHPRKSSRKPAAIAASAAAAAPPDEIELGNGADEIWAQPPPPKEPAVVAEDEAVDRWIHAEARAERMHAEVDRAQAELMAMLARSADLEESVVTRDDELDAANAELERVRLRVAELEGSIARSDAGRDELERALADES